MGLLATPTAQIWLTPPQTVRVYSFHFTICFSNEGLSAFYLKKQTNQKTLSVTQCGLMDQYLILSQEQLPPSFPKTFSHRGALGVLALICTSCNRRHKNNNTEICDLTCTLAQTRSGRKSWTSTEGCATWPKICFTVWIASRVTATAYRIIQN